MGVSLPEALRGWPADQPGGGRKHQAQRKVDSTNWHQSNKQSEEEKVKNHAANEVPAAILPVVTIFCGYE